MIKGLPIAFFLFIAGISKSFCQNKFNITEAKDFYLNSKNGHYKGTEKIPFKEVIIRDLRFDSTKLGYIKDFGICRIVLGTPASQKLTQLVNGYYGDNFTPSSDKKLLIIVKTLWLQKDAFDIVSDKKIKPGSSDLWETGACIADFEIFSMTDTVYTPLIKIKDNFFSYPYTVYAIKDFLLLPFDSLFEKISSMDMEKALANKKNYTRAEIDSGYLKRFELPALAEKKNEKGVFLTFESFKQNQPVYPEFTLKTSKLSDEMYIPSAKGEELLTDFWGFCDGQDYYMKIGFNFFKLARQNNTWDLYGTKYITNNARQTDLLTLYGPVIISSQKNKINYRPLQLNMETGKVY